MGSQSCSCNPPATQNLELDLLETDAQSPELLGSCLDEGAAHGAFLNEEWQVSNWDDTASKICAVGSSATGDKKPCAETFPADALVEESELQTRKGGASLADASISCDRSRHTELAGWGRARPLCVEGVEQLADSDWQLSKLAEARALIKDFRSGQGLGSRLEKEDVLSWTWCPPGGGDTQAEIKFIFRNTWQVFFQESFLDVRMDLFHASVLHEEPDLLELPYIRSIRIAHKFAPNFAALNLKAKTPVLPGVDDIHVRIGFDLLDEVEAGLLFFYWSPPESASEFNGWTIPPIEKFCRRGRIDGMILLLKASTKPGCCHVTALGRGELPVPRWLIPNWVVRMATQALVNFAVPHVYELSLNFNTSSFQARVSKDSAGFYAALHSRLQEVGLMHA